MTISEGWSGENEWEGYLAPHEKIHIINPERGWIATANNDVASEFVKFRQGNEGPTTGRAIRIYSLIEKLIEDKSGSIVEQDMKNILADTLDVYAERKINYLAQIFSKKQDFKEK